MTRRKLVNPVRVPGTASDSDRSQEEEDDGLSPLTISDCPQTEALNCCVHEQRSSSPLRLTKRGHEEVNGRGEDSEAKRQAVDYSLPRRENGEENSVYAKTVEMLVHSAPSLLGPLFPGAPDSLMALQNLYGGLALHQQQQQALAVDLSPSSSSDLQMPRPPSHKALKMEPGLSAIFAAVASRALELRCAIDHYRAKVDAAERKAALLAKMSPGNGLLPLQPSPTTGALPPISPLFTVTGAGPGRAASPGSLPSDASDRSCSGKKEKKAKNGLPARRRNDRRSDAEMNEPNVNFQPESFLDTNAVEQVRLSSLAPHVTLPRETYTEIIKKGESSATRVIRMLMKHFFPPETLAASSLSGTGTYKQILDESTITAIRDFINQRYPKLKNSRLNLCMTDVCVQARRVKTNQTKRSVSDLVSGQASPLDTNSSRSHHEADYDLHVSAPSLPMALERPISPPSSDELERNLVMESSV